MNKKNSGFSLAELMVSVSIMTILMSVVLYGYNSFIDKASLSSEVQDLTITIREAQSYGINAREVSPGSGQFSSAYGVYFNPYFYPTSYFVFIDKNNNDLYDSYSSCGSVNTESLKQVFLKGGVYVDDVCTQVEGVDVCSGVNASHTTFKRPNTDAIMYFTDKNGSYKSVIQPKGKIKLKSKNGDIFYVVLDSTGQITAEK